jgi:hypothetical protein
VTCYLHTSAAMRLLVEEDESAALSTYLQSLEDEGRLVSSWLMQTELQTRRGRYRDQPEDGFRGSSSDRGRWCGRQPAIECPRGRGHPLAKCFSFPLSENAGVASCRLHWSLQVEVESECLVDVKHE